MAKKKSIDLAGVKGADKNSTSDDLIVQEAKDRFELCVAWEGDFRKLFIDDVRFCNGDSDNMYQWPDTTRNNREIDDRPCLTINKTKQHCLQIINDNRQHSPQAKVRPIDSGATVEAAKLIDGYVRHVEYASHAQSVYNTAQEFAVMGGIGFWRITTEYANDKTFDQDIFIRRIRDPLTIYLDPDIKEVDGSDAQFGFIFVDYTKKDFTRKYGESAYADAVCTLGMGSQWLGKDHVRVCEYFRIKNKKQEIAAIDAQIMPMFEGVLKSNIIDQEEVESDVWNAVKAAAKENHDLIQLRSVDIKKVEWFLIAGNTIIDRRPWPGRYIPIIRVVGEELVIDGKLERKGHTRALKDPQRMYNYWTSSATEQASLQTKTPYVGEAEAFEGYQQYWDTQHTTNYSYLPYNGKNQQGEPVQRPQREPPPQMSPAYLDGMKVAASEMMMVSGQYQAIMGQQGNETSGVAIQGRQRQGENATYHYIDHLSSAVRFSAVQIVDLMPHVIDTPRMLRILGEDGVEDFIHIDPNAETAHAQQKNQMTQEVKNILNPKIGRYDVVCDVGPAYATRRQEAFASLSQIMSGNPELLKVAGDLLFKAADFPMAQELAERLHRTVPPNLLDDAPNPQVQQLQQHLQQMDQALKTLSDQLIKEKNKNDASMIKANADQFRSETERAQFLHDSSMDQHQAAHDIALAVLQTMQQQRMQQASQESQEPAMNGSQSAPQNAQETAPAAQPA